MADSIIHPTAVIERGASIGSDCRIGPYCVIGEHVRLGDGNLLQSHVVIDGYTTVGDECQFYPFCCIGKKCQDLKFKGEVTYVEIGSRNEIREYVTIHLATGGGNRTVVGDDCLIQAYCHVAHECRLGNAVIMSSGAMLAGHVQIDDFAIIGGCAGVLQFVRIGTMAMVGGFSKLVADVLPFTIADGAPAEIRAVNKIGMTRRGKSREAIRHADEAFRILLRSNLTAREALLQLQEEPYKDSPEIRQMVAFVEQSQRGLARSKGNKPA